MKHGMTTAMGDISNQRQTPVPNYICTTCGTQFAETGRPPDRCPICDDERQYVGPGGQRWTTLDELLRSHRTSIKLEEPGLTGIGMEPSFAIGQRALLVQRPGGNVLWGCIPLIDDAVVAAVRALGGISAIAISHPHFYSSMVEWSRAFGNAQVHLHAADRQWVMRPDPVISFWEGNVKDLGDGLTLIRYGGHFDGGTVLHWRDGAGGRGALLSGDIIQVVPDRRFVSFMYSYPNLIPLPASVVRQILGRVEPFEFDRIYGAWSDRMVERDAKAAVARSAEWYVRAIGKRRRPASRSAWITSSKTRPRPPPSRKGGGFSIGSGPCSFCRSWLACCWCSTSTGKIGESNGRLFRTTTTINTVRPSTVSSETWRQAVWITHTTQPRLASRSR